MSLYRKLPNQKIRVSNPKYEWLEKNYPGFLHTIFMQGIHAGIYEMHKLWPFGFRVGYCLNTADELDWFWDARDLTRVRNIFLKKTKKDLSFFRKVYQQWLRDYRVNVRAYERAEKVNFGGLTDSELFTEYERLYHANIRQGATGYLADSFLSAGGDDWLSQLITNEVGPRSNLSKIIQILTAPTTPSYVNEAEIELAEIRREYHGNQGSRVTDALDRLAGKYYWLENNYFAKVLTAKDFARRMREITKLGGRPVDYARVLKVDQHRKLRLLKSLGKPYLARVIKMSELMTHMQDYRKMVLVRFAHFQAVIFKEMARRTGLTVTDLRQSIEPELEGIFLKRNFDRKLLRRRAIKNFAYGTPTGYVVYESARYKKYVDETVFHPKQERIAELKGTSASPGMVRGVVRIVKDAVRERSFRKGQILVTNNTTPEFVPLMKLAGAIVTEQGGITTHAAIVSRELKIPCVIGTKVATKVLKDGDLVEVDAERGIVKILKKVDK